MIAAGPATWTRTPDMIRRPTRPVMRSAAGNDSDDGVEAIQRDCCGERHYGDECELPRAYNSICLG